MCKVGRTLVQNYDPPRSRIHYIILGWAEMNYIYLVIIIVKEFVLRHPDSEANYFTFSSWTGVKH